MRTVQLFFVLVLLFVTHVETASAHAVFGEVTSEKGTMVRATYDGGDPMGYAEVEIFYKDEKLPFQTGRTDRNGCFLFLPDKPGAWKMIVSDGMGHRLALSSNIDDNAELIERNDDGLLQHKAGALSRSERVLMGISIIFGVFGILFWWSGRRIRKKMGCVSEF